MSSPLGMMMLSKIYKQILIVVILSIASLAVLFYGFAVDEEGWDDFALLLVLADVIAGIRLIFEYRQHDKLLKQLQVMTANIVDHHPAVPLFVEPDNPLKGVADQLNELQSRQQDEGKSIRNSNAELITILSSLPVGVMVIDSGHDVIFANHKMSVMLGRDIFDSGPSLYARCPKLSVTVIN